MSNNPPADAPIGALSQLPDRMREILLCVLAEYVESGQPVGSRAAARRIARHLSPATVRSAMSELMALGLLSQPHTSAGRAPTDSAFRLWVDSLLRAGAPRLTGGGPALPVAGVDRHSAADLLSEVTGQLGFFLGPEPEQVPLERVHLVRVSSERVMALLVMRSEAVRTRLIEEDELDQRTLDLVAVRLSEFARGRTLEEARRALADEIERERARSDRLSRALRRLGTASLGVVETELYVGDRTPLLRQPEFADVDELLGLLSALEEKERMLRLLNEIVRSDSVRVVIGEELDDPLVRRCAVVTAQLGDSPLTGGLGVIGPVRMRYDRVIPLVCSVSARVADGIA